MPARGNGTYLLEFASREERDAAHAEARRRGLSLQQLLLGEVRRCMREGALTGQVA